MSKAARKEKNQRMAMEMKRLRVERRTGRCCICYRVYNSEFYGPHAPGYSAHRCSKL